MSDDKYIEKIKRMGMHRLLSEILEHGEYLTDPYYRKFGQVITETGRRLLSWDPTDVPVSVDGALAAGEEWVEPLLKDADLAITEAVAAERERCARIAEGHRGDGFDLVQRCQVANEIRSGE